MPEVVFSVDQSKSMRDQAVPGHNRWHPDIPPAATVRPGDEFRVECREWTDAQLGNNDSVQRRARRRPHRRAHAQRARSRSRAPSRATCSWSTSSTSARASRRRSTATRPGQGWGYTGHLRQGQRRRLPHRPLPRRLQGDLGLPRPGRDVAPHPRRPLHRHHPPRAVRHRAVGRAAGRVEPPRAGADRHRPGPGAAAGAAAARGRRARRHASGRTSSSRVGREGARTVPGARERRQPRHQELHPRQPRLLPGARRRARSSPAATCTSPRATARSRSAAPSRWAASSTSAST